MSRSLHDHDIEQSLLGILLCEPQRLDEIPDFTPSWFHVPVHARIYDVLASEWARGNPATAAFLAQYFQTDVDLERAGGAQYLTDMVDNVVSLHAAKDYAAHLQALYARRALLSLAGRIKAAVTDPDPGMTPEYVFNGIEKFLTDTKAVKKQDEAIPIATALQAAVEALKNPATGLRTGVPRLDLKLGGGLFPGALYILAGRPGMGKTALGLTLAANAALEGRHVQFFSLEMTHQELSKRLLSRFTGMAVHSGVRPYTWAATEEAAQDAARRLATLALDDAPGLCAKDILARARRHKKKHGLELVVVDYLGLVLPEDRKANKVHQIEEIAQSMKRMAKDLGVPVLLLCQLSRGLEGRDDKRPQLSDLRDSGAIEQEADAVMFVYREEYYAARAAGGGAAAGVQKWGYQGGVKEAEKLADLEAVRGQAELIIAKHRQGELGTVPLKFDGATQVFTEA